MEFHLINADITTLNVDAIVNAANNDLLPGGGVCGVIYSKAGHDELYKSCLEIGHCNTGESVITPGFNLPSKYIIHTVGPVYRDGNHNESKLLESCYLNSLDLAKQNNIHSIAFPLISSGIYGYPKKEAYEIAYKAISNCLTKEDYDLKVYLCILDNSFLISIEERSKLKEYISSNLIGVGHRGRCFFSIKERNLAPRLATFPTNESFKKEIQDNLEKSFSDYLLKLIDERNLKDSDVYKKAGIDRKLFSKIRRTDYQPSKDTALKLCIALNLNTDDTKDLLGKAGYALSQSIERDLIIQYCITNKIFDLMKINNYLFSFNQKTLD